MLKRAGSFRFGDCLFRYMVLDRDIERDVIMDMAEDMWGEEVKGKRSGVEAGSVFWFPVESVERKNHLIVFQRGGIDQ